MSDDDMVRVVQVPNQLELHYPGVAIGTTVCKHKRPIWSIMTVLKVNKRHPDICKKCLKVLAEPIGSREVKGK
jgi:hypothetical protein